MSLFTFLGLCRIMKITGNICDIKIQEIEDPLMKISSREEMNMTIYDIAKLAGVSASTVSRVINNKAGIKESTRQKVKALLKEYNYTPDENARGLVNKNTKLIGIMLADIRSAHHTDLTYVVEKYLRQKGYCGIILNAGSETEEMEEAVRLLEKRRVDGMLVVGSVFQNERVKNAISEHFSKIPVVFANGEFDLPNVYSVLVDECGGVERCVDLLVQKQKGNIAFIGTLNSPSSQAKLKGFKRAMTRYGKSEESLVILDGQPSKESGYQMTQKLLEQYSEIQGVIYSEDLIAAGGMRAFWEAGVKIPDEMAIIGIDNTIYGELSCPQFTSLDNKMTDMASEAARILVDAVEGRKNPRKIMLFSDIIEREST